jgi:hypothetical protein
MWWANGTGECVVNGRLFQVRPTWTDGLYSVLYKNQYVCLCDGDPFDFVSCLRPGSGCAPGDTVQEIRKRFLCNDNR